MATKVEKSVPTVSPTPPNSPTRTKVVLAPQRHPWNRKKKTDKKSYVDKFGFLTPTVKWDDDERTPLKNTVLSNIKKYDDDVPIKDEESPEPLKEYDDYDDFEETPLDVPSPESSDDGEYSDY